MDGVGRVIEQMGEPAGGESARSRKRDSLFMVAQMRLASMTAAVEVRVRNLSEGGLMVEYDRAVEPGAAVTLEMRGLGEVTGTVAWCTRGRLGIALDAPIDPKRARKPVGAGAATPDYAKPIVVRTPRR